MASPVHIIAIFTPPKDSVAKFAEILGKFSAWVKDNEPGTTEYDLRKEVNSKTGVVSLFMIETYKDKAAFKAHSASKEFQAMFGELGKHGLKDTKIDMKFVEKTAGFSSRL